ncbi:hypothetical protein J2X06_000444 [Lysobacter niastensis]|uniref:Glycosyltransferase RgtA/B/C/D-like domain-containing protein n=1 Tax=Lysobacter niastensis TaxID=380629 RepID=A0ABU1W7C5_9GAMM|nr:hypothetical protein [Lysobacter niastensis]MDR7133260.1 hypothetical protein [Lysobacter niastensis]
MRTRLGTPGTSPQWMLLAATFACVLIAQAPLVLNPGYFSHDELQWAAFAGHDARLISRPQLWTNLQVFQYRPLTFSLWLALSKALFAHPQAFHGAIVAWGAVNAALLALLLRRVGVSVAASLGGALVFALGPFAMHTHGWVGTIGDLIWVGCALATGLLAQRERGAAVTVAGSAVLTAIGLLAKESAIVIPAVTALGWLLLGRRRGWALATAGASVPALAYLALRLGVLLFSPREAANYGWSLAFVPLRWLEYQLYPSIPTRLGITGLLGKGAGDARLWVAGLVWLALAWTFWRVGPRWLLGFLLLGAAALGPVLILAESANQYGYGFAAATAGLAAAAWARVDRTGRIVFVIAALLSVWHGVNVMRRMHEMGELQATFSPAMANAVVHAGSHPVRLRAVDPGQHWIYLRLMHDIPSYAGVAIGERVQLVDTGAEADYEIGKDGGLRALR